ncbi:MAG: multidrug effflux MFS transporter [Xanthomonadales bacterium]|nr:multidrug effflux MFS transporter [Xanthomonadales bacterium]NNK51890.1 multidrug effflux MFS transporter [Xanthomonadales bacterium]
MISSKISMGEFVALMAFSMSLVALSIDVMLPAFPEMTRDLRVGGENEIQLVLSFLFVGLALGQLFYGPLSDSIGRKPAIYLGFALFIFGSLMSMAATSFSLMLAGRFLQGLGAAGPRTVSVALIRDRFEGSEMARVMSFILTVFVLVPIFAPALGQAIVWFAGWRVIFGVLILLAVLTLLWLGLRQPETLPAEQRKTFTLRNVAAAFRIVITTRLTVVYTLVAGCVTGAFLGYLNSSQQIFQVQYELGLWFPLFFAMLAMAVGVAALLNGKMVLRFGMHALANRALLLLAVLSWLLLAATTFFGGHPPLWLFMLAGLAMFFCIGVLFGNLNAIAMEPLGHVAGTAAAVIGSTTTFMAVLLGFLIGRAYDGSLLPLVSGFVVLSTISVLMTVGQGK